MVARRATRNCSCPASALPARTTLTQRSCESAAAPASARPATTARMVAKATAAMKPRNGSAERLGEQRRRHVAAGVDARITSGPTSTIAPNPSMNVIR
jgi:hypothetical protein